MRYATLRQLRTFEAVIRHRNFTRAAEELCLSQSSVSEQIKELTDIIGLPLLEYVGKHVYVTEIGNKLLELYKNIELQLDGFYEELSCIRGLKQGRLRLAAVPSAHYFLPRLLSLYIKEQPDVEISLKCVSQRHLLERMTNNIDDLYIFWQLPKGVDIKAVPLVENPLVVLARPDHPLAGKKNIYAQDIGDQTLLLHERGSALRELADRFVRSHKLSVRKTIEMDSNEAIKQGIISGLGISILSQYTVEAELTLGELTILNVEGFPVISQWHVGYLAGKEPTAASRSFIELLKKQRQSLKSRSWAPTKPPPA